MTPEQTVQRDAIPEQAKPLRGGGPWLAGVGVLFMWSGVSKAIAPAEAAGMIADGLGLPAPSLWTGLLVAFEIGAAGLLLVGTWRLRAWAGWASIGFLLVAMVGLGVLWMRGWTGGCGCGLPSVADGPVPGLIRNLGLVFILLAGVWSSRLRMREEHTTT